jgi:hypothetical protein
MMLCQDEAFVRDPKQIFCGSFLVGAENVHSESASKRFEIGKQ